MVSPLSFAVAPDVLKLGIRCATFVLADAHNQAVHPGFEAYKEQALCEVLAELSEEAIETDPVLQGFRDLHTALGISGRKNIAASENLLKNLLKNGTMPHVNLLVDIYNLVSIQTRLALGAHDVSKITGSVHLRFTTGTEQFHPIGSDDIKRAKAGCYAYIDDADDILCLLEVRQVEKTKTELDTTDYFFIIQGNANTDPLYIQQATATLISLLQQFCGGQTHLLNTSW